MAWQLLLSFLGLVACWELVILLLRSLWYQWQKRVFPLICGWWLGICSLEMSDATLKAHVFALASGRGVSFLVCLLHSVAETGTSTWCILVSKESEWGIPTASCSTVMLSECTVPWAASASGCLSSVTWIGMDAAVAGGDCASRDSTVRSLLDLHSHLLEPGRKWELCKPTSEQ